jgi:hypothetical protein
MTELEIKLLQNDLLIKIRSFNKNLENEILNSLIEDIEITRFYTVIEMKKQKALKQFKYYKNQK